MDDDGGQPLTVADIAALRNWSRVHAWRWLESLRRKFGPSVVSQERGGRRRLTITRENMDRVLGHTSREIDPRIHKRLADLERLTEEQTARIDVLTRDVLAIKAQGHTPSRHGVRRP
jgi:molybdenum-dependent DNA-binding transcriptional regulator ModE